jgi:hypothetical protein
VENQLTIIAPAKQLSTASGKTKGERNDTVSMFLSPQRLVFYAIAL